MHPQVIGRGHRLLMLEKLVEHIRSHPGVSFVTMSEVASEFRRGIHCTGEESKSLVIGMCY